MTTKYEAMREALEKIHAEASWFAEHNTNMALFAEIAGPALAMPDDEPVAYMCEYLEGGESEREYNGHNQFSCGRTGVPLYAAPQPTPEESTVVDEEQERRGFEKAMRPDSIQARRDDSGRYTDTGMEGAWTGWKAGRAALRGER